MKLFGNITKHNAKEARANLVLLAISLICAVAGWFIVSIKRYPSAHKELYNIPVELDISGTEAAANGINVLSPKSAKVNISFDCSRIDFSKINNDTVRAYVDFKTVDTVGSREMTIQIESKNGMTLSNIVKSPATITVNMDKFETKTFPLKAKTPNINSAEGMVISEDEITCTPAEINITAPSAQLSRIAECYAVSEKKDTLSSTTNINSEKLLLLDEDGNPLDQEYIKSDSSVISINIPVLSQKTVKLGVNLGVLPENFDPDCLNFTITPETITIAAKDSESNLPDPFEIPAFLNTLDIGYSSDTDINKLLTDNGIKNVSNTEKVNITLNSEGLSSKEIYINCEDIPIANKPSDNNDYTILTHQVKVKIVGPEDIINELTAQDLTASVNLLGVDTSKDQFEPRIKVSCKTHNNVWAVGDVTVKVQKRPKDYKTSQSSTVTTNAY